MWARAAKTKTEVNEYKDLDAWGLFRPEDMDAENARLRARVAELERQNAALLRENAALKAGAPTTADAEAAAALATIKKMRSLLHDRAVLQAK